VRCQSRQHPRGGVSNFLYRQGVPNKGANKGKQRENKGRTQREKTKGHSLCFLRLPRVRNKVSVPLFFKQSEKPPAPPASAATPTSAARTLVARAVSQPPNP
jgi:hypothetical protein